MNCPFCKSDYQSELLQEGRCPKCGGVVEWKGGDTDDFDTSKIQPKVTVDLSPRMQSHIRAQSRKARNGNGDKAECRAGGSQNNESASGDQAVASSVNPSAADSGQKVLDSAGSSAQSDKADAPGASNSDSTIRIDAESLNQKLGNVPNPDSESTPGTPDHPHSADTTKGRQLEKSTDVGKKVINAWSSAASGIKDTYSTIRTDQEFEHERDSIRVVINERRMKSDDLKSFSPDYDLLNQIGQGAVGVVYAAQQNSIDREVAVKMLQGDAPASDDRKEKFLFEAVVTGDLDHPNIVPVHELGKNQKGDLFYSMKKIEGQPWSESIRYKTLAANLDILLKVCDAIAFAHSRGIIHRDLKPENIMLGEYGEVLVVDWGIALPIPGYSKTQILKFKPSISGTPAYMAPEMAIGPVEKIGVTSDVYLLGAILFEIITRKTPHEGKDALACVVSAAKNVIVEVDTEQEPISIARKALSTEPGDRYQSVTEFKEALHSYQSHVESISLADRAEESFETAKQTKDYQDYSKALFAYEEALELWPANKRAILGIRETNYEYAKCALEKSDFDLGLSRVDENDKKSRVLGRLLKKGALARDRRKSMVSFLRNIAIGLVLVLITGGTLAFIYQKRLLDDTRVAEQEANQLLVERDESLELSRKALEGEQKANERSENALLEEEKAKKAAEAAKEDAVKAKEEAQENLEKLQEATYATNLDVAGERIEQNAFKAARDSVSEMASRNPGLLHWEWGRINHLCNELSELVNLGNQDQVNEIKIIDRINLSQTGDLLAVGEITGQFHLLYPDDTRKEMALAGEGESAILTDLEFDPTGNWLAVAGQVEKQLPGDQMEKAGVVRLWNLRQMDLEPVDIPAHGSMVTAVAFAPGGSFVLTSADDNSIKRWSLPELELLDEYSGHRSQIHDIDINSTGTQFITSADKDVRIWEVGTKRPIRRYPEHRCPVYCVRFIEDGKAVLSGDSQGRLFRWTIEKSSFLDYDDSKNSSSLIEQTRERVKQLSDSKSNADSLSRNLSDTQVLKAHKNSIRQISLSNNGQYFLTAAEDNVVRVWSNENDPQLFAQWMPTKELRGHGGHVFSAVFGDQDATVYSGGQDKCVRKWNINDTVNFGIQQVRNQVGRNLSVSLSPNHEWLAFGKTDGTTVLQNINDPTEQKKLAAGHDYLSNSTVLTPDRTKLITAAGDNTARIWDFAKGTETKVIQDTGRRGLLCLAGNGETFATGTSRGDAIRVFSVSTMEEIHKFTAPPRIVDGQEQSLDFSAADLSFNGKYLLGGDSYGHCYLWEVATGDKVAEWKGHFAGVVKVAFLGEEDRLESLRLVTAGRESVIAVWEAEQKKASADDRSPGVSLNDQLVLTKAVVSKGNNQLLSQVVLDEKRENLVAIRTDKKKDNDDSNVTIESLSLSGLVSHVTSLDNMTVHSACYVDDRNLLIALTDSAQESRLYSWRPGQDDLPVPYIEGRDFSGVNQMVLVRDLNQLLTVGGKGVQRWDLESGELEMDYRSHAQTSASAFSPDGKVLVTGGSEGAATIWETRTGKQKARIQHSDLRAITAIEFIDEDTFLLVDQGGNLFASTVNNQSTDACQLKFTHTSGLSAICLSRQSGLIYVAGLDGKILSWNEDTKTLATECEFQEAINCLAISPNGQILAAGTNANNIHLWDIERKTRTAQIAGHSAAISSLEFSLDGLRLVSAARDGNTILWDLTPTMRMSTVVQVDDAPGNPNPVDAAQDNESSQIKISELFSLSGESNDLLTAKFVNRGTDILIANSNGFSRVQGSKLKPAFRLTRNALEMARESKMPIDSSLTFSVPTVPPQIKVRIEMTLMNEENETITHGNFFDFEENRKPPIHVIESDNQLTLIQHGETVQTVGEMKSEQGMLELELNLEPQYLFLLNDVLRSIVMDLGAVKEEKVILNIKMNDTQVEAASGIQGNSQEETVTIRLTERDGKPVAKTLVLPLANPVSRVQGQ